MSDAHDSSRSSVGLAGPHGGDLLVAAMDALGVDTAFGVVSVHNMPLVEAVARSRRFVPVRHEAAAVNAADGYGRARDSVGVAITSTGTGAGNAAGSLIESLSAGSRVLHVTGQIETAYLGQGRGFIHETKDQLSMLEAVSLAAHTMSSRRDVVPALQAALRDCLAVPGGPVSVEWPIDLQYLTYDLPDFTAEPPRLAAADSASIQRAIDAIAGAQRPILWIGGGARRAGEQIERLVDRTRAGVVTSNSGRGVLGEGHGACIGNYPTAAPTRELLGRADVLVSIGSHFRSNETDDYGLELPDRHVQFDIDPKAIGRSYPVDVGVVGDAAASLRLVLDGLPDRTSTDDDWLTQVAACRRTVRMDQREAIGWQAAVCDAVRSAFPREAVFVRDVTIPSSTWGNRLFGIDAPRLNVFPRGGGIGQGLAMGVGAAVGQPDVPTLALVGDGGLAVHLGELLTLAQEQPWLVLLVYNDRGYGVLRNTQDAFVGHRSGVDLATPDFVTLVQACGLPAWSVSTLDDLEEVLAEALQERGPAVVELDVDALGPMPRPFTPPVRVPVTTDSERPS